MSTLLDIILTHKKAELAQVRRKVPLQKLKDMAAGHKPRSLRKALQKFGLIAEIKAKSPSMGSMDPSNVRRAISLYQASVVVRGISVLTDAKFFGGSLEKLRDYRKKTTKPLLRKDFIFDEYQIWEAKAYGADALLLMASVHRKDPARLRGLFDMATGLGLEVLIEFGAEAPPQKNFIPKGYPIFGINSRKFKESAKTYQKSSRQTTGRKDLTTDLQAHFELVRVLSHLLPGKKTVIAESGISRPEELKPLRQHGFSAALIGTSFLRKGNSIAKMLKGYETFLKK